MSDVVRLAYFRQPRTKPFGRRALAHFSLQFGAAPTTILPKPRGNAPVTLGTSFTVARYVPLFLYLGLTPRAIAHKTHEPFAAFLVVTSSNIAFVRVFSFALDLEARAKTPSTIGPLWF